MVLQQREYGYSSGEGTSRKNAKGETPVAPVEMLGRMCLQAGWVSEVCVGAQYTEILQNDHRKG
jgi:hypothetical protein